MPRDFARCIAPALLLLFVCLGATGCEAVDPAAITALLQSWNLTGRATLRTASFDREPLYERAFGDLDIRGHVPMPLDARFPIASNTKLYVAISLYQLQEEGLVDLSRPVQDYLTATDFAAFGHPEATQYCPVVQSDATGTCRNITFVQLLDMTACIPDLGLQFLEYPGSAGLVFGRYFTAKLTCVPGTTYYYSNPAFMMAAYFVEKFSGLTFAQYIKKHISDRIGQTDTYYDPFNGKFWFDPLRVEEYYEYIEDGTGKLLARGACSSEFDLGSASGAGGIVSTHRDEALLYFTLFNFSKTSVGAPLFTQRRSLLELVRPRTNVGSWNTTENQYYAQGLFVAAPNSSVTIPDVINYEGAIICSHTANLYAVPQYDATFEEELVPARMMQVWSAVLVAYATSLQLEAARNATDQDFYRAFGSWPHRESLMSLARESLTLSGL